MTVDYEFESGSDPLELRLASRAASAATGTVVFGEGTVPPVDPDEPYPPDDRPTVVARPIEGFAYTLRDSLVADVRVRFSVETAEHYEEWCQGQTAYLFEDDIERSPEYACLPNRPADCDPDGACVTEDPVTGEQVTFEDWLIEYCLWAVTLDLPCACTAEGCGAGELRQIDFDLRIDGDNAEGTVDGLDNQPRDVFLTRQ